MTSVAEHFSRNRTNLLNRWIEAQLADVAGRRQDLAREDDIRAQSNQFFDAFMRAITQDAPWDAKSSAWSPARDVLARVSASRAQTGFTPYETATFVFSLKQPLFESLQSDLQGAAFTEALWKVSTLLDGLGLFAMEAYQKSREEIIQRQQQEMLELSTPVVELWTGILALPLIGTLDSSRTQVVMESLLNRIVETGAAIAIIDITGVPMVDTLVAQHLLKTIAAARLMGADCIISGIRPQIAQTIVHLGVELNAVVTKATLASAFSVALRRLELQVTKTKDRAL